MIMIQDSLLTLLTKDEDRLMDSLWGFDCWVLAWVFFFTLLTHLCLQDLRFFRRNC